MFCRVKVSKVSLSAVGPEPPSLLDSAPLIHVRPQSTELRCCLIPLRCPAGCLYLKHFYTGSTTYTLSAVQVCEPSGVRIYFPLFFPLVLPSGLFHLSSVFVFVFSHLPFTPLSTLSWRFFYTFSLIVTQCLSE